MNREPGHLVGGKYRLEKPLAKGGMGSVWVARHTELEVQVAVKFMAPELVGTVVAETRFKREARAAAQLRSPHVVHIHDYGVEDGAPYMVMELLFGGDLSTELTRAGRLGIGRIASIVSQVAKALSMAHAAGIVHRDLKPSNLFLALSGEDEIVKILDFGVAKETAVLAVDKTTSGMLVGSPQYMSPEQARGEHIDFRSDLWSLGVVVFEALTGRPPFESTHLGALLSQINEATFPSPTSLVSELPLEADAFMKRALARQPEDRFDSAKEFAEQLAVVAMSTGETVPAITSELRRPASIVRDLKPFPHVVVAPRAIETAPGTEPAPVSTTMSESKDAPAGTHPQKSKTLTFLAIGALLVAALAALWFGFLNPPGGVAAMNGPSAAASSDGIEPSSSPSSAADSDVPSARRDDPTVPVVSPSTSGAPTSSVTSVPQIGTAATASRPSTEDAPSTKTLTGATKPTSPAATNAPRPAASQAVSVTPAVSVAPVPANTAEAHDPVFGLPEAP